jgi:hypothetical protein
MSNRYDFELKQGEDFSMVLTIKDEKGIPIDITSYTFESEARLKFSDVSPEFSFTFTISNQTTNRGQVVMSLANAVSETITILNERPTSYVYDVEMEDGGSKITRILEGRISVTPEATK